MTVAVIGVLVDQARAHAELILTDTLTILRDGATTVDGLGTETVAETVAWTGPGLVQVENRQPVTVDSAGRTVDASSYVAKLPIDVTVYPGDRVRVDDSLDPQHVGRVWMVRYVPTQAWMMLRRCPLDQAVPAGD